MREWITLLESPVDEEFNRRTTAHKPLEQVTVEDCARAMLDADDLRNVLTDGFIWQQCYEDDEDDVEQEPPPIPANSAGLTPDMLERLCRVLSADEGFEIMREELLPISQKIIPINRRLNRLADLSKPLGVHWTFSHNAHRNADGSHYGPHVVYGHVDPSDVDWITTVTRGIFWWHNEAEITPVAGSQITLVKIEFGPGSKGVA